ncbi:hypothetical protein SIIN_538_T [Serendipita indica DSM 11827]|uniref:CFEM domain-containing protein n=1 Tax=Serendipita indica (strain DSM 11827) TaxID=1109443 RepID=G4TY07_SERID|nr:hypothetical protein SIIN_538_T [Serendipita indica DSM 11827]CCA76200.1 hypothetical protein PIIN_10193 [Serendipita indica DSM 11827]
MFKLTALLVATAALVAAQGTADVPECVLTCSTNALEGSGCTSITDTCICTSTEFQTAALACLTANCTATEQQAALTLQSTLCGNSTSGTASGTASATGSANGTASATGSHTTPHGSTTGTQASTSASSTSSPGAGFHTASMATGAALALFGAAVSLF